MEPDSIIGSPKVLFEKTDECAERAESCRADFAGITSEYYFMAALLCVFYLKDTDYTDMVLQKGRKMIGKALEIIPEDDEYRLIDLLLDVVGIDGEDPVDNYSRLKQLVKDCPSFKLMEHSLMTPEFLEDVSCRIIEEKLCYLIDSLPADNIPLVEEAAEMLKEYPSDVSKLKAYSLLASIYFSQNKLDEALRVAKLGIELLGTSFPYDENSIMHHWWSACWTIVGRVSRAKGDPDFAMSVFEKGQMLEIVPCIRQLAEMYQNGEGEDADPEEAARLTALADSIDERRARKEREEEERRRKEEEARLEKIRLQEEEVRRQEEKARVERELKKRRVELMVRKGLLIAGSVACLVGVIWGIVDLRHELIIDRVAKYEKSGLAILRLDQGTSPHAIIMDKKAVYFDDSKKVTPIVNVGVPMAANGFALSVDKGVRAVPVPSDSLKILTSRRLYVKRLSPASDRVYLISNNPSKKPNEAWVSDYYLLINNGSAAKVIKVDDGKVSNTDLKMTLTGDILPTYEAYFRKRFSKDDYLKVVDRQYGSFSADVTYSFKDDVAQIDGMLSFNKLGEKYSPTEIGKQDHMDEMYMTIKEIFHREFIESLFKKAERLTRVTSRSQMRMSPDERFIFVIANGYAEGKNSVGLLKVDNNQGTVSVVDKGMEVTFESDWIHVKRSTRFLLIFSSSEDVYYNYYGSKMSR